MKYLTQDELDTAGALFTLRKLSFYDLLKEHGMNQEAAAQFISSRFNLPLSKASNALCLIAGNCELPIKQDILTYLAEMAPQYIV